jgi:hypothetical protein
VNRQDASPAIRVPTPDGEAISVCGRTREHRSIERRRAGDRQQRGDPSMSTINTWMSSLRKWLSSLRKEAGRQQR